MGNIHSEVGRAFNAKRQGNKSDTQAAVFRAIDLFDATASSLIAKKSPKTKEVLRAKEQFLEHIYSDKDEESAQSLDRYFAQFALAARLHR